jgi:phage gpG-like protein
MFVLPLLCENELLFCRLAGTCSSLGFRRETLGSARSFREIDTHALVGAGHSYAASIKVGGISGREWANQTI